jgi:hypothetical protein
VQLSTQDSGPSKIAFLSQNDSYNDDQLKALQLSDLGEVELECQMGLTTPPHWNLAERLMMWKRLKQYHSEVGIQNEPLNESQMVKSQDRKMNDQIQIVNEQGTPKE